MFNSRFKLDKLVAVVYDGTIMNTGAKYGDIRYQDIELNFPFQWLTCRLHINELSLCHFFKHLEGGTTGYREYSGTIGKMFGKMRNIACGTVQ